MSYRFIFLQDGNSDDLTLRLGVAIGIVAAEEQAEVRIVSLLPRPLGGYMVLLELTAL